MTENIEFFDILIVPHYYLDCSILFDMDIDILHNTTVFY